MRDGQAVVGLWGAVKVTRGSESAYCGAYSPYVADVLSEDCEVERVDYILRMESADGVRLGH